ncbi:hypothetical protein ColKHC_14006 [Colletotrichum higginsianum]|nr:hypothetical protein ColKHC_14006 [Colletotrichum higginsianum]
MLEISDNSGGGTLADLATSFKSHKQCLPKDQRDKFVKDEAPDNLDDKLKYEVGEALAKAGSSKGPSEAH